MTAAVCSARRSHAPAPLTIEQHHVIPRAWQAAYRPASAAGLPLKSDDLWDPRTVPLCPTCHRNVHYWIVRLMHGETVRASGVTQIAALALRRFTQAGGDLDNLRVAGLWGEA